MQPWNGAVGGDQLAWLQQQLAEAAREKEKVIVFSHFPAFPANPHNLWNNAEVIRLLESYSCVVAYLNGHNHAGHYGRRGGIHYVTLPGMVETPDTTAYAVVQLGIDHITITGFGRTPSQRLTLRTIS